MSIQLLKQVGLSNEQSKIYLSLVSSGTLTARKIFLESGVNRSLVYKVLKQLMKFGLVTENVTSKSVNTFSALHPSRLQSFIKRKEEDLALADQALNESISVLSAQFNLTNKKPSMRFYEGIAGIKSLYKDIINTKENIKLIKSPLDKNTPELEALVKQQIKLQVENNITAKVITPIDSPYTKDMKKKDKAGLVTRCVIPQKEMNISAQIMIYGDNVALTSFKDGIVTTIIENKSIAETFSIVFKNIWNKYYKK